MSASTRWLAGVAAVIVIAVVAAMIVAATGGSAHAYPEGSPKRVVQQYLQAVSDRDAATAVSFLAADLQARCQGYPSDSISNQNRQELRATLERATVQGDSAQVRVNITESYGDAPFNTNESSHVQFFELRREGGAWRFSAPPWPLFCPPIAPRSTP